MAQVCLLVETTPGLVMVATLFGTFVVFEGRWSSIDSTISGNMQQANQQDNAVWVMLGLGRIIHQHPDTCTIHW